MEPRNVPVAASCDRAGGPMYNRGKSSTERNMSMSAIVTPERPDTPDAIALITELEATLEPLYPRESRHGLSVERLITEGVPFFVLRSGGIAASSGVCDRFRTP